MRACEFLTEVFDRPYAYNWSRGDHGDYDVFVKLPDGSPLSIAFNHEDEDTWHVAFDRGHSQEVTGEGDAQRIFATVLHSINQFIKKQQPEKLYFSASKEVEPGQNSESRANLYDRMVKRYASAWGYDSVIDDFGRDKVTYILNKKQTVAEDYEKITEYRDRMYQYIKSIVPGIPDYVVKDWLYDNFAKGATQVPGWSFETIGKDIPNILKDMGLSVDTKWQLVPNMKFTMDMWEPKTLKRLQARAGGSSKSVDPDVHIPARDAERHTTQATLAKQQGGVRKEPVILLKTSQGYELIEGWHRTIQHFAMYPQGYTGPAYVAVAQGQQGVAEGRENFNGLNLLLQHDDDELFVKASAGGRELGHVLFVIDGDILSPQDLEVDERYRGQGIAQTMYDFVKSKGYKIRRSGQQTDAGRGFWDKHRPEQNIWEGTADDINKMFNKMYDPMTTNLQRVALMAMQGRQHEAVMQLNRVIKDASPEAQKKITDAVNNIKPVTVNGKIADSSTLDKSKKHQDWILNTFIPWVQSLLDKQDMTEEQQSTPTMGINVRSDGDIDYAGLIINGKKKYESRQTDSLRPYVGKTVAIVRTGSGPAVAIGQVTVGEPIVVDASKFDKMRKQHLVPQGSKFDIGTDTTKYLYPMINPVRWDSERPVKQRGIVARKID